MERIRRLPARIALVVGAGALLVGLGVTLLLVNTVKLHHSADATGRSDDYWWRRSTSSAWSSTPRPACAATSSPAGRPSCSRPTRPSRDTRTAKATLSRAAADDGVVPHGGDVAGAGGRRLHDGLPPQDSEPGRPVTARRRARLRGHAARARQLVDSVRARAAALESLVSSTRAQPPGHGQERGQPFHRRGDRRARPAHHGHTAAWGCSWGTWCSRASGPASAASAPSTCCARACCRRRCRPSRAASWPSASPGPGGRARRRGLLRRLRGQRRALGDRRRRRVRQGRRGGGGDGDGALDAAQPRLVVGGSRRGAALPQPGDARREPGGALHHRRLPAVDASRTGPANVSLACAGHPPADPRAGVGRPPRSSRRGARCWASGPTSGSRPSSSRSTTATRSCSTPTGVADPGPGPERRPAEALRDRASGAGAGQLADTLRALRHRAARGPAR